MVETVLPLKVADLKRVSQLFQGFKSVELRIFKRIESLGQLNKDKIRRKIAERTLNFNKNYTYQR